MEAETGVFPAINKPNQEPDKQRLASLMEKLRARNPQHRTWVDTKLAARAPNMAEKRHNEAVDKNILQTCLDSLQKAIKVCNHQTLLERFESIARQVGLNYNTNNDSVFISSDMFFIEILIEKGGVIKDVKIVHQGDPMSCPELTEILQSGKFEEFIQHLEGLQKIYQLNGDKKIKTKGFLALQSIEKDLNTLAQLQSSIINGVAKYIHKSPLGILLPRKGGLPMELMYFVSPYDLLDKLSKTAHPLTVEAITEYNLGQRVTISMEPGPPKKLQTMPLMTVNKTPDGKSLPSFTNISNVNSHLLPACFTLVLKQPIPVSLSVVQKIQSITSIEFGGADDIRPLLDLLLDNYSQGQIKPDKTKQLFVSLPDQHHTYYINGVNGGSLDQPGLMVASVPFVHPTSVPKILNCLRQQLLFNAVVSSVIRPNAIKDISKSVICELTTISMQQLSVTFEHPAHDDIVTVEMDLGDITNPKCRVATTSNNTLCSDDLASRIFQRCMSVPITVRSILKRGKDLLEKATAEAIEAMRPPVLPPVVIKPRPPPRQYIPPPQQLQPQSVTPPNPAADFYSRPPPYSDTRTMSHEMVSPPSSVEKSTPLLANLLEDSEGVGNMDTDSPMLSRLLEEQGDGLMLPVHHQSPAMSSQPPPMSSQPPPMSSQPPGPPQQAPQIQQPQHLQQQLQQQQQLQLLQQQKKMMRKRRSVTDIFTGRSPKQRISDGSSGFDRIESFDLENSSSPFDAGGGAGGTGGGGSLGGNFQASGSLGSVIDLTEDAFGSESNLKKLADSVDSLIPHEMTRQTSISESELTALLSENDVGGRSLLSRNSPQNSKNEKASISLEGLLGEVGDNKEAHDPILANRRTPVSVPGIKSENIRSDHLNSTLDLNLRNELFGTEEEPSKSVQQLLTHRVAVPQQDLLDSKYAAVYGKGSMKLNSDLMVEKKEITGIFEKLQNLKGEQQLSVKKEKVENVERSENTGSNPVMKLKLSTFRAGEGRLISPAFSSEPVVSKKSGSCTFDFTSDDSDDDPPGLSYSSSVYSPTRLQLSHKAKNSHDLVLKKTNKYKHKEAKYNSKTDSLKRKKLKDESKKERKKRKMNESSQYIQSSKETVYHSVESDQLSVTKLKIRVGKEPSVITPISPEKERSDNVKKSLVDKYGVSRQEIKDKERQNQKSPHRSKSSNSQGTSESGKTDPKLAKATIRLKPLHIPNSGSSVTVHAGQKSSGVSGKTIGDKKSLKSGISKQVSSGSRTASPNISALSFKNSNSSSNIGKNSPNICNSGRTSSPSISGTGKTSSPSISSKSVLSPNLSATGKSNSPNVSASGKTSSPILSASSKTSSPSVSGLAKSSSVNKTYNSVNKLSSKSGSGLSGKQNSLSSSKSSSSLNSGRSSLSNSSKSSSLSKSSSTSTLGSQPTSMSMSAYLPNAPSASKVARLPPIPKLSSSQASSISHSSALNSPPPQSSSYSSTSSTSTSSSQTQSTSSQSSGDSNSHKTKPNLQIPRARKGSLSAVIDKLTKGTGTSNALADNPETSKSTSMEVSNSRDPRINSSKADRVTDKNSVQSDKFNDKKVVQRPDSININKQRNSDSFAAKPVQKSPTTNKVFKGDNNPKKFNASDYSNSNKSRSMSDSATAAAASPRLSSILKSPRVSSPTIKSSPSILKNSQNSVNYDSAFKSNKQYDTNSKRERSRTPTSSSPKEERKLSQTVTALLDSSKFDIDKLKASVTKSPSPLETALDLSVTDKSPKISHHGSSFIPISAKYNGDITKDERESFKSPTPKLPCSDFKENDIESPKRKSQTPTPTKNNLSPRSDTSSPDIGLIIDCPTTPTSKDITAKPRKDNYVKKQDSSEDLTKTLQSKSMSSVKDITSTIPNTSPISATNSPCEIDDDLMDEALLGPGE